LSCVVFLDPTLILRFRYQLNFYKYLEQNYASNGFTSNLYLQNIQAGTEVFTGSNAKLNTQAYSISVN